MMNKKPYRSDMINFFPGKRERFSDRTGNPLPHPAIRALSIISFPGFPPHGTVAVPWKNLIIRLPNIRMNNSALSVNTRYRIPQFPGTFPITASHMNSDDFLCLSIFCQPYPILISDKRPHLITSDCQTSFLSVCDRDHLLNFIIFVTDTVLQPPLRDFGSPCCSRRRDFSGGSLSTRSLVSSEIILFSGCSTNCLPHCLHRNLGFPLWILPFLIVFSELQTGHIMRHLLIDYILNSYSNKPEQVRLVSEDLHWLRDSTCSE